MKHDFLSALGQEIRDEVMERYVTERRLMELQIESLREQSQEVRNCATELSKRLTRLGFWMRRQETRARLINLLHVPEDSPWLEYLKSGLSYELYSVQVGALRNRIKLRKIIFRSYQKAYGWNDRYVRLYRDLQAECDAVNSNIKDFHRNFDTLTVLNFLKRLDPGVAEKSHFLGGNFSAQELTSIDQRLRFHPVSIGELKVAPPISLPVPDLAQSFLEDLADEVFESHREDVKKLIQTMKSKGY